MTHDTDIYHLLEDRDEVDSNILLAWCKNDEIRYNLLVIALADGKIEFYYILPVPSKPTNNWNDGGAIFYDPCPGPKSKLEFEESKGILRTIYIKELLKRRCLVATSSSFRAWLNSMETPAPLTRNDDYYSGQLKTLDKAYQALYIDTQPDERTTPHQEKKRILAWLKNNSDMRPTTQKRISKILNPFRFPRSID